MGKFIVIVSPKDYKKHLANTMYKYLPDKLLFKLQNKINPRIICKYVVEGKDEEVGYGIGFFLDKKTLQEEDVEKIVTYIKTLNIDNIEDIIIDEYYELEYDIYKEVKDKLGIISIRKKDILIDLFDYVLEKICKINNINLLEQNTLVTSTDDDATIKVVMDLSRKVKYLTISGENDNFINNLGEKVFNDNGLSILKTNKLKNKIKDYNIILNLRDDVFIEVEKLRKKTIIFDYSNNGTLSNIIREKRRDILVIDDYIFKENSIVSSPLGYPIYNEVTSNLYILIREKVNVKDFIKIKVKDKTYTIKQASKIYLNMS